MRIRSIKPEFWTDKRVASWDPFTRLFFIGLWSAADDHGRGSAEPVRLGAELFPYDLSRDSRETLAKVSGALATLSEGSRIELYEAGGEVFYQIANWTRHQRVDKPGKSRIPTPNQGVAIEPLKAFATPSRDTRDTLATGAGSREQGAGSVEQGAGEEDVASAAPSKKRAKGNDPEAASVLSHLNAATGRAYQPTEATLREIRIRITEVNGDIAGIIKMIDRQKSLWGGDAKMAEYLRPSTLFRQSKFHDYYAAKDCPTFPAPNGHHRSPQQSLRNTLIAGSDEWDAQAAYDIANRPEGFGVPWDKQNATIAVPATARPGMEA
jgi:uncharacterized phage protein (TIGR02220 family)